MKQTAILYALGRWAPRLIAVRARTWIVLALAALTAMALLAWAAVALLGWAWNQAGGVVDTGKQTAGAVLERVEQAAPGVAQAVKPWLGDLGGPAEGRQAAARDVSGADPAGLDRYAGLVRTYYANDAGRLEVRFTGAGDMQTVVRHYVAQLENTGYRHDVLLATPASERHRFSRDGIVREIEVRRTDTADGLEVVIVEKTH
ncbi:MAG: hypothetical protein ACK4UX_05065 [Thiobacillus sp.]